MNDTGLNTYLSDIVATQELLTYSLATAFLLGFIYMIILRLCGGPIIYLSILSLIGGTTYGGWLLYTQSELMPETEKYKPYYLYGSYVVFGIAFVLLCCVCFNQKNIRIGVAIMKCTAAFIGSTPQVFLVPPLATVFVLVWFFIWFVIALHIASIGDR